MKSKIAKQILEETPEEIRIFVRQYTNILTRVNRLPQTNGYTQKHSANTLNKKPSGINKGLKGNQNQSN